MINDWWSGDPAERYWMEITDREVLGSDLTAPQANAAGRPEWSYTLVTMTSPGDVVFHWHSTLVGRPALVGFSVVEGPLGEGWMSWQAHGTRGRERGKPTDGASWTMPLGGFTELATPLALDELSKRESVVMGVREALSEVHPDPLYFPFSRYRPQQLRAAQAYLVRFPAGLVDALPELAPARRAARSQKAKAARTRSGAAGPLRRGTDAKRNKAVERHAVEIAKLHYSGPGVRIIELGKPYDLRIESGRTVRHVEVKGSTLEAGFVELTVNEVSHAQANQPTDLFVVDNIDVKQESDGSYTTSGGRQRVWTDWAPEEDRLMATAYSYQLPSPK